ncbi:hypothetical protein B5M42_009830 [Paenibacillus athensensis]|nr:hypothetical protein [Paenibacillus athensensis]MCD1259137.1 hypothetical protein [Paenibacillus athensensis]
MTMKKFSQYVLFGSMSIVLTAALLTGCEKSSIRTASPASPSPGLAASPSPTPQATADTAPSPTALPTATPEDTGHEAQVSSNEAAGSEPKSGTPGTAGKQAPKPKVNAEDAYKQEKPTLMGLTLGTSKDTVLKRFGKSKNQFIMDEDDNEAAITVYEYADFSVGFRSGGALEFVDISSGDIDPGLGGLRLGQTTDDAVAVLGKPDTRTEYVLSYKAQGTVLKLDLDPKSDTIQSIKLFADR